MSHALMIAVGLILIGSEQHIMLGAGYDQLGTETTTLTCIEKLTIVTSWHGGRTMRKRRRFSRMPPTSTLGGRHSKSLYWELTPPFLPCCVLAVVLPLVLLSFSVHILLIAVAGPDCFAFHV